MPKWPLRAAPSIAATEHSMCCEISWRKLSTCKKLPWAAEFIPVLVHPLILCVTEHGRTSPDQNGFRYPRRTCQAPAGHAMLRDSKRGDCAIAIRSSKRPQESSGHAVLRDRGGRDCWELALHWIVSQNPAIEHSAAPMRLPGTPCFVTANGERIGPAQDPVCLSGSGRVLGTPISGSGDTQFFIPSAVPIEAAVAVPVLQAHTANSFSECKFHQLLVPPTVRSSSESNCWSWRWRRKSPVSSAGFASFLCSGAYCGSQSRADQAGGVALEQFACYS